MRVDPKLRFHNVVRRKAERRSAREDVALVEQIRRGIAVCVEIDGIPRYELIRGDTGLLSAQHSKQATVPCVQQVLTELHHAVGADLPQTFDVDTGVETPPVAHLPPLVNLVNMAPVTHSELETDHAVVREADTRLAYERNQHWPLLALRGSVDRRPDLQNSHVGLVMSIPLSGRHDGPVGEAMTTYEHVRALLCDRGLRAHQAAGSAYHQYETVESQVGALEPGVIKQTEPVLRVAEAIYRRDKREIFSYLDTQHVSRQARNDPTAVRADLRTTAVELDCLRLGAS